MPEPVVDTIYGDLKTVRLKSGDSERAFVFPKSGSIEYHLNAIFSGHEYALPKAEGYTPHLFLDIGANIGATAVYFTLAHPDADVVCFEPSPRNFELLVRNTEDLKNIQCFDWGLSDERGEAKLYIGNNQCMQNSLFPSQGTSEEFETCRLERADESLRPYLERENIVLKIDTEGAEIPILRQISSMLDSVDWLFVEYHSESDRRELDDLLCERFVLAGARSNEPHLGINRYVARRLLSGHPELEVAKINRG